MLGHFLEISIPARPVQPALEFYRSLGFKELTTGDILPWPYAAVWDGSATLGLQDVELAGPVLTFVRPDLEAYIHPLRRAGVEFEYSQLADDQFNQAAFADPNGQIVVLLEARTFSPATWEASIVSGCGTFLEFSVATHSVDASTEFWGALGFQTIAHGNGQNRWARMSGRGLTIGFHEAAQFPAGLTYRAPGLRSRLEYLKAKGFEVRRNAPVAAGAPHAATLRGPEGTPIYLVEPSADEAD